MTTKSFILFRLSQLLQKLKRNVENELSLNSYQSLLSLHSTKSLLFTTDHPLITAILISTNMNTRV